MPSVPIPTWEQAAIIILFVVLMLSFMAGFFALAKSILKTIQEISLQFQTFIADRDKQWQDYFEDREQSFKERNQEVVKVLQELIEQFREHATETTKAIATMSERTTNKSRRSTDKSKTSDRQFIDKE